MKCVTQVVSWLVGKSYTVIVLVRVGMWKAQVGSIDFGMAIEKWTITRLQWGNGRVEYRILLEEHRKKEYMKASEGSHYLWFCDLLGGCCEGSQDWIRTGLSFRYVFYKRCMRHMLLPLLLKELVPRPQLEPNCIRVLISKSKRSCILQCVRGGQGGTLGFSQKAVLSWLSLVQVSLGEGFVTGKAFGIQA